MLGQLLRYSQEVIGPHVRQQCRPARLSQRRVRRHHGDVYILLGGDGYFGVDFAVSRIQRR
jgi:hypothetical protein